MPKPRPDPASDPALSSLEIIYRDPTTLKPHPRNTRTHSKAQVAQIAQSIRNFGFTNPILIDEQDEIIAGHGRLLGAKACELQQVPVIELKGHCQKKRRPQGFGARIAG